MDPEVGKFQQRVLDAAEHALETRGSVGPIDLLEFMMLLPSCHIESWRKGRIECLESSIQGSPKKLERAFQVFYQWAEGKGLKTIQASYLRAGLGGNQELRITNDNDPEREKFFRTHFAPGDLPESKTRRLKAKLERAPDLVVFQTVSEQVTCSECKTELYKNDLLFMEKEKPLCLTCADLDHLVFLPSGDGTLSRRARKNSPLSAVVVRFNRSRKRYERQGILVTEAAIITAEDQCAADAPERAELRAKAAERRVEEDKEFFGEFTQKILKEFPKCPTDEARGIAKHTALRGSGRVGRSAAGRALNVKAVTLAVIAHIRHTHTKYDSLLMKGVDRSEARESIRGEINRVIEKWTALE